jgi:hypothetical protein
MAALLKSFPPSLFWAFSPQPQQGHKIVITLHTTGTRLRFYDTINIQQAYRSQSCRGQHLLRSVLLPLRLELWYNRHRESAFGKREQ